MSVQKCININLCAVQKTGKGHRTKRRRIRRRRRGARTHTHTRLHTYSGYSSRGGIGKFVKWRSHVRLLCAPAFGGYICYFIWMVVEVAFELVDFMEFELFRLHALPFLENRKNQLHKCTRTCMEKLAFHLFIFIVSYGPADGKTNRTPFTCIVADNFCYPLLFLFGVSAYIQYTMI